MTRHRIIRNCDICGKEDNINCESGLCPDCEHKDKIIKDAELFADYLTDMNMDWNLVIDKIPHYKHKWETDLFKKSATEQAQKS